MALNRLSIYFVRILAAWIAVVALFASEHHGTVKSGGLPVPGATVVATQGDQRHVTTTDENGRYSFADLKDGVWKIEVEMLGFAKLSNEIGIAYDAPAPEWNLKFLPLADIVAPKPAPAPATSMETAKAPEKPVTATPATTPAPPPTTANNSGGRGNGTAGRGGNRGANGNNGRPSLTQAMNNFQRVDVNASGDLSAAGEAGNLGSNEAADLSNSADASLMVNGSLSRGLDGGGQNDWFGGPGGRPMDGMGGPGGFGMGMGPGGDGTFANAGGGDGAGRGGRGGPGGPGGPGGMGMGMGGPGGPGGFGGRGGPGGFGGGFGGRGGPGGRGGRGGDANGRGGRAGVASFGNARRDRRMQINGNASFSLDNSAWDASPYSLNGQNTEKPAYAKARASMMIGGPLKIPHLLDGRRGTFTFNYQLGRTRNGTTSTQSFPTMLERSGDFSQSIGTQGPVTIYDPLTGAPFPGNVIPSNRISQTALGLLKYYPTISPAITVSKYDYQAPIVTVQNSDNINTRLSQTINSKNRINGGLGYMGSNNTNPNIFGFIDTGTARNINANVSWGHNFTTRVINNLRYTFSRSRNLSSPFFAYKANVAANLGINGTSQDPRNWGPPNLNFTNYGALSDGTSALTRNQTSSVGDSLIWVKGVHNLTFGVDFRRQQFNRSSDSNGRGAFTFNGLTTANVINGTALTGTGYDFADFLLGLPDTSSIRYGNGDLYFRSSYFDAYVNDDWRLSTKLTINGGFRWDYATPISELFNRMVNLDVAPGFVAIAQVLPGQSGPYSGSVPSTLVRPDRNNFSPRFGFAYRPGGKRNIVIRGGYGIYYNSAVYNTIANNMAQQPPFASTLSVATSAATPLTLNNGFIAPVNNGGITNTYAIDPNYRTGYAQNWQLAIQSDLGHSLVGTVTYNGIKGTRLDQLIIPNSAPSGAKPLPYPAGYQYEMSNGDSIYHGVSFQLQRRFRNGISANAIYTFSKSIDDVGTAGAVGTPAQDFTNTSAERALSASSRTHVANFNWQYSTGVGRRGGTLVNGWKGALLKDWTFTNAISVGSGFPLTPVAGGIRSTTTGTGITGANRAMATGLPANDPSPGYPFNVAAFVLPLPGQWGNAGRDTIIGPNQFSLSASLGRVFRIGERHNVDLRFDANNALNHVTFRSFNTTIGSTNIGLLSGPSAMRSMTATLRFRW
jgi:hypothetical protein